MMSLSRKVIVSSALLLATVSGSVVAEETKSEAAAELSWGGVWGSVKDTSGQVWNKTKESSGNTWEKTKEVSGNAWDSSKEYVTEKDEEYKISDKTKSGWYSTKEFFSGDKESADKNSLKHPQIIEK